MTSDNDNDEPMEASVILGFKGDRLEPDSLKRLIPLKAILARRKGETINPKATRAVPTGYCAFTTRAEVPSTDGNAQVEFVLAMLETRIAEIRKLMAADDLTWDLVFFDGDLTGQSFADLRPDLLERAAAMNLPIIPEADSLPRS